MSDNTSVKENRFKKLTDVCQADLSHLASFKPFTPSEQRKLTYAYVNLGGTVAQNQGRETKQLVDKKMISDTVEIEDDDGFDEVDTDNAFVKGMLVFMLEDAVIYTMISTILLVPTYSFMRIFQFGIWPMMRH